MSQAPTCDGQEATIVGTAERDVLTGTSASDVIVGLGGADSIAGGGGADVICGDGEADRISGGAGNDWLSGGGDTEWETPAGGHQKFYVGDVMTGGPGDDVMDGDGGTDTGPVLGDDRASYASVSSPVRARLDLGTVTGEGTDAVTNLAEVVLTRFSDTVLVGPGIRYVSTGAGNDVIRTTQSYNPSEGLDHARFFAGAGADVISTYAAGVRIAAGAGNDSVIAYRGTTETDLGTGTDRFRGSGKLDDVTLSQDGADVIKTFGEIDLISVKGRVPERSRAVVETGAGADFVGFEARPARGARFLLGDGNDHIMVNFSGAGLVNGGPGVDLVDGLRRVTINLGRSTLRTGRLPAVQIRGFERAGGSWESDRLVGSAGANILTGGGGNDTLFGLGGRDRLVGNAGHDRGDGGPGFDRCVDIEVRRSC